MSAKLCALSIDLDPLTAYYEIHGLGTPPPQLEATIMRRVLPRFLDLFAEAGVRATFFVVGRELEQSREAQEIARRLVAEGHELGNHTYSHPYELCQFDEAKTKEELLAAHRVIVETVGDEHAAVGFRSPGYFINRQVTAALASLGYRYDSSMFPSPPYYLAKIAIMAGMALRGRRSASVINDPRGLTAPTVPYRLDPARPWNRGDGPLIELPVTVLPYWRIPAIGTLFAAGPDWLRSFALERVRQSRFFNFELHGIDLADAVDDSIPTELAGRQPDLRIPFAEKRRVFLSILESLQGEFAFVTLAEAARRLADEL